MFGRRINSGKTRAWSWREEEVPTTDGEGWNGGSRELATAGLGLFFAIPPELGGSGAQRRPRDERSSCAPTDTTHRAPTSVRTLSSPHPTRPHTSSAGATFGTPLFFSFCHFQPAGEHGNRCFPCEGGVFFWLRAINHGEIWTFRCRCCVCDAISPRGNRRGAASMGGRRLVEVPLPTTHRSGASSRPPLPPGRIPPPPPSSDPTRMTLFHRPPHHLAPRERKPWAVGVPIRCWKSPPPFFLGLVTCIS